MGKNIREKVNKIGKIARRKLLNNARTIFQSLGRGIPVRGFRVQKG